MHTCTVKDKRGGFLAWGRLLHVFCGGGGPFVSGQRICLRPWVETGGKGYTQGHSNGAVYVAGMRE